MRKVTRRDFLRLSAAAAGAVVAACAPAAPEVVEIIKEVPVEKEVVKEVIKEVPVEKEVIKEVVKEVPVEKEKVVEKVVTAVPVEAPPPVATPIVEYTPIPRTAGALGIEVDVHWEGMRYNDYRRLIDDWNTGPAADRGVYVQAGRIRTVAGGEGGVLASYMADYQAGQSRDIYHTTGALFVDMVDIGMVIPAPPEVEAYVNENYLDASANGATWEGKVYGYPTEVQAGAMLVNGFALDEIGHSRDPESLPKTWEEFRDLCKALIKMEGSKKTRSGMIWETGRGENQFNMRVYMHAAEGEPFIDVDNQTCNFDSEAGLAIGDHWYKMAVEDGSTTYGMIGWADAYAEQVGTVMLEDEWLLKYNVLALGGQELFDNTICALSPTRTGENFKAEIRGYNYMVSSQSKNPEAAWEFLQWLNELPDARMANWMVQVMGFIPNHKTGVAWPEFWNENMTETYKKAVSAEVGVPWPKIPKLAQAIKTTGDMQDAIASEQLDVQAASEQGADEIEQAVWG
jgi:ABC-type glycerol-3-phosphate transport system substrate-binding protein